MEFFEFLTLERKIVHLADKVDYLLEPVPALFVVFEFKAAGAYVQDQVQHVPLPFPWAEGVDRIESVLLQESEVKQLSLPECLVIGYGDSIVAEDIDLVAGFLALADHPLEGGHFVNPSFFDILLEPALDFRIFKVLGIGIHRTDRRIAFLVGPGLLEGIEAPGSLLSGLSDRFLEVTAGRGDRAYECDGPGAAIVQDNLSGAGIEARDD